MGLLLRLAKNRDDVLSNRKRMYGKASLSRLKQFLLSFARNGNIYPTSEKVSLVQGAVRLAMLCEFLSIPFGFLSWRLKIPVQVTK